MRACKNCKYALVLEYYSKRRIYYCTKMRDKRTQIGFRKVKALQTGCPVWKEGNPEVIQVQ